MQIQRDLSTQFQLTDDYVLLKPFLADAPISTPSNTRKPKVFLVLARDIKWKHWPKIVESISSQ